MTRWLKRLAFVMLVATIFGGIALKFAVSQFQSRRVKAATGQSVNFPHQGREREYRIHVPKSYSDNKPIPLLDFMHGGGGDSITASVMGVTSLAEEQEFIVVYPNAINRHWNDGRKSPLFLEHDQQIDDADFVISVVEQVKQKYSIDRTRVFCAGVSNGGFMTQRLAIEKPEVFAAAGIFIASMGEPLKGKFDPKLPVSLVLINGTKDPLVPYDGGPVKVELFPKLNRFRKRLPANRGTCIATEEVAAMWVKRNGISEAPTVKRLPDTDSDDGSHVEHSLWTGGQQGTAVALYKVIGGGHTVPGGQSYARESMIGKVNRDMDGLEAMWQFFNDHARRPK